MYMLQTFKGRNIKGTPPPIHTPYVNVQKHLRSSVAYNEMNSCRQPILRSLCEYADLLELKSCRNRVDVELVYAV